MLPCPLHYLTGLSCPFCGTQRLLLALLHGRVGEAFWLNPLVFVGLCLMLVVVAMWFMLPAIRPSLRLLWADRMLAFYLGITLLWGIIRNVFGI